MLVDRALAQRLESSEAIANVEYARTMKRLYPDSDAEVQEIGDGYAVFMKTGYPVNGVAGLGMRNPVTETNMEAVEAFFQLFRVPIQIRLCPYAHPSLVDALGLANYRVERFFTKLVRQLSPGEIFSPPPPEITVEQVTPDAYDAWAHLASGGDPFWKLLALLCCHRADTRVYLARYNGELAGNAALSIHDGLASLFYTATLPQFQRRGVQAALIHARLRAAVDAGCDLATVAPIPGTDSERNVQRHGFQPVYTRIIMEKPLHE